MARTLPSHSRPQATLALIRRQSLWLVCCQALQEADSVLCTLGALQMEDHQRPLARTSRALRALGAQLLKSPGPQALAGGGCFKAAIEVRAGRRGGRAPGLAAAPAELAACWAPAGSLRHQTPSRCVVQAEWCACWNPCPSPAACTGTASVAGGGGWLPREQCLGRRLHNQPRQCDQQAGNGQAAAARRGRRSRGR